MTDGLDTQALAGWCERAGLGTGLTYERIAGGRSNLTYRVSAPDGRTWILRRPPLGERLASAHDMVREHRILSALAPTSVPVPTPLTLCEDTDVTGAEFYVMEDIAGVVLRDEEDVDGAVGLDERHAVGLALVDTMVTLHAVDPEAVGLGDLGRHEDYAGRQLRRWQRQWEAARTRELPAMEETHALLSRSVPEQPGVSIVHGDYRLDNVIVGPGGAIAAVLDWELCTLGDPLADLGLLMVYWVDPGDTVVPLTRSPTSAPGFPAREELVARYAERSGRDVSALGFFTALGYWKLAAILEGVHARNAAGAYGERADDGFLSIVEQLAELALDAARRL